MPTSGDTVIADYEQRRGDRLLAVRRWEHRHAWLGGLRIAIAGLAVLTLWLGGMAVWPWVVAEAVFFLVLVAVHARVLDARDRAQRAVDFYDRGLQRLQHAWPGQGDTGARFAPAGAGSRVQGPGSRVLGAGFREQGSESVHLYADDLDLFGRGSAFELLGTCRTEVGQVTLASWLLAPAAPEVVRARQAAVRELVPQIDLREALSVEGAVVGARLHPDALRTWALAAPILSSGLLRALAALSPLLVGGAIAWRTTGGPGGIVELALLLQLILVLALRPRVVPVIHAVDSPSRDLDLLMRTARILEETSFTSPALQQLQSRLSGRHTRASVSINRLSQLVAVLSSRRNVMFAPLAALLLWATQLAFVIEAWRSRHGHEVPAWLDALGEFEALAAVAGFAAEHPTFVFPAFVDDGAPQIAATALAHPLLPETAVPNDVGLGAGRPVLLLVSGSNMSGKSTYLRTIGLTVVLAHLGAPVRATTCTLSPLVIGASIRVADSLQDGHSRFYAEILRLKQIVDLARASDGRMLFLLDEMLSGTNSHDRRHGADGVLRGLTAMGAIGLATTHDLALGDIVTSLGRPAAQVHFSDIFEAGSLQFDYQLRPGPVQTSNALALMRSVGLEVDAR